MIDEQVRVEVVPPDKVEAVWPKVVGGIAKGCAHSHGLYTPEALYAAATASPPKAFVMVAFTPKELLVSAVAVISVFPTGKKAIEVLVAGGKKHAAWVALLDAKLTSWAQAEGASLVMFSGRKGWRREVLKLPGWRGLAMTFGKILDPVEAAQPELEEADAA